ncbi:MAG: PKD domain-containing protein [Gammaproteobacteria bacterium]
MKTGYTLYISMLVAAIVLFAAPMTMAAVSTPSMHKLDKRLTVIAAAAATQRVEPLMASALTRELFRQNSPMEARWNAAGQVQVYLHFDKYGNPPTDAELTALGATDIVVSTELSVVQAWIPADELMDATALSDVVRVTVPRYAFVKDTPQTGVLPRTGSVDTEGDTILGAQQFRQNTNYTGQGMVVGVISGGDSGVSTDQGTGDLPANVTNDPNNTAWQCSGAEGTAMMEIVYDLAPGVKQFGFACPDTTADFLTALDDFAASTVNANVIVDDLGFPGEAMFTNGNFASGVASFAAAHPNVHLVTAAGNDATAFWAGTWNTMTLTTPLKVNGVTYDTALNFDTSGGQNPEATFQVQPGDTVSYIVEWNDPWDDNSTTNDPNGDYDVVLFNSSGTAIACNQGTNLSTTNGQCNQTNSNTPPDSLTSPGPQPIQGNQWQNKGASPVSVYLEVFLVSGTPGPNPGNLGNNLKILISSQMSNVITLSPNTPAGSIYAQSALPYPTEITAGALCKVQACPDMGEIESYSSQGPVQFGIPGTGTGTQPTETIYKPDFVAPDCVSVTGVGGFGSTFCGTSAAGPHIAGLITLLLSAYPSTSPYTLLQQSATPFGSATPPWPPCQTTGNGIYGCGQPYMETLLQTGIYPATGAEIASPASGATIAGGTSTTFEADCLGYDGGGAFTYKWDFGTSAIGDSSSQNPSVTYNTAGTYTVTLTCTNTIGSGSTTSTVTVSAPRFSGGGGSSGVLVLAVLALMQFISMRRR